MFIDTEKLSKMEIPLQVFFKDFTDRFRITYLKNGFLWSFFSRIFLIDFRIATNLQTGLSKKCSCKILFIYLKTTTKIYLKVLYQKILKSFGSNISCVLSLAVSNCWGFCQGKQCFYSNDLGKNIAKVIIA